jgi:hypothetical protein
MHKLHMAAANSDSCFGLERWQRWALILEMRHQPRRPLGSKPSVKSMYLLAICQPFFCQLYAIIVSLLYLFRKGQSQGNDQIHPGCFLGLSSGRLAVLKACLLVISKGPLAIFQASWLSVRPVSRQLLKPP